MTYVNFTSFFLRCAQQQHPKHTISQKANTPQSLCSDRKDKGCKNLARTSKTRQANIPNGCNC